MLVHELRECPVCGFEHRRPEELGDGHVLCRCESCDAVFAPAYADPGEIYRTGYLTGEVGKFGLDIMHPLFQRWLMGVSERRFDSLRGIVQRPGSVLDVGCGAGEFLAVARERGWAAHGLDPVPDAAAHARDTRGLDVATATLEEYGTPEPRFDLVSALHVLEHVPRVQEFLRTLAAWCRPGGHLLIEVPNYASLSRKRKLGNWPGLRALEHVTHFTPDTLSRAFRLAGLEPVRILTPTYAGRPQELTSALSDLELSSPAWRRALAPTCVPAQRDGVAVLEPGPVSWAVLGAVERTLRLRGAGAVVLGIARVAR